MVTGKTGAGKSTLINGLIGLGQVAPVGKDLGGVTREVTSYSKEINGVQFNIWDAPGLQDTTESDDVTLDGITAKLKQDLEGTDIHLFLFCHRMDTDRLKRSDELVFKSLTDHFGRKIWEISVIALTFANKDDPPDFDEIEDEESRREEVQKYFKQRPIEYKNKIVDILKKRGMDEQKASQIAVIPTGYHKKTDKIPNPYKVLDIEDWFNQFWITCAERMKETALVPLLMSQRNRENVCRGIEYIRQRCSRTTFIACCACGIVFVTGGLLLSVLLPVILKYCNKK